MSDTSDKARFKHSVLRERIIEHAIVADLMRRLWQLGCYDIEVLRAEFDRGGYDFVFDLGGCTRHVQAKVSAKSAKTSKVPICLALSERPSGCVLWVIVTETLSIDHYLWLGGLPSEPLPPIDHYPAVKRTTFNSKLDRPVRDRFRNVPPRVCTSFKFRWGLD